MPLPLFERLVEYVTAIKAAQINSIYNEVEKIAPAALLADYCNVETVSANRTLNDVDMPIQRLTPSGANRDVILPLAAVTNHPIYIRNPTGSAYSLIIKNDATTLATLAAGEGLLFISDGSTWAASTKNYQAWSAVLDALSGKTSPSGQLVGTTDTQTLTNKRINPRVVSEASSTSVTIAGDSTDLYILTALAAATTFNAPSGTPVNGQKLIVRIKDNGTARGITWNAIFRAIGVTLPTTTKVNKVLYLGFIYNSAETKWDCIALAEQA